MNTVAQLIGIERTYTIGDVEVHALRGVDLEIEEGAFLSIAGPSGSGKTTVLNILGALDKPTAGEVRIDGSPTSGLSARELADFRNTHLGFVFQTFNLIPVLTVRENVELPLQLVGIGSKAQRREMVEQLLTEVGLATMMDRRPNELSGGQQQRVAVARALVKRPTLVLADEPTANLDSTTSHDLMGLMQNMNRMHDTTFVFSTHDPLVMEYATRIVRLRDGKVESDERVEVPSHAE